MGDTFIYPFEFLAISCLFVMNVTHVTAATNQVIDQDPVQLVENLFGESIQAQMRRNGAAGPG